MEKEEYLQQRINEFWEGFLSKTGRSEDTKYIEVFHFELSEKWANELLRLVLIGQKKATASSLFSFELSGEPIPKVGDLSIVTNWEGDPKCVIETTAVTILPFSEVTYDIAKREGEDQTLESWQKGHIKYYKKEGEIIGYEFNEDLPIVFEDFKVVYQVKDS
ncbi:ASCH domain-containing protein [Isachenkonia alkalipeptolytica]|uniref:ASCH domain-containing protein n=1 Tax=Isachenkonia alkalipeptolytica TaxID=2565777 RepID=A0AA44BE36_9CLOT|nr:ASCH domain-containing protein [Isachenkonia alkalipeptolytica]NBG87071.1 ASCH domain-containing protein [Isachenkonia alkalipeptolytica]